jgi:hypothetical protein
MQIKYEHRSQLTNIDDELFIPVNRLEKQELTASQR